MVLGLRDSATEERIKDAHRRIMIANHPDSGSVLFSVGNVNPNSIWP
jgi:DnaJ family protein C protein 19